MKTGDRVTITCGAVTLIADLTLCSANEKSLFAEFDGSIVGHIGAMPILMDDDGAYRSVLTGAVVTVRPLS